MSAATELPRYLTDRISPEPNSGCWLWTGPDGGHARQYGRAWFNGRLMPAHRAVLSAMCIAVPDGLEPDHTCRTPCCVNPDHLEMVTHQINTHRSTSPIAANVLKTHCKNGHELAGSNLMISRGKRCCRECYRRWKREWSARNAKAT